jgi:hypothetical protein
VVTRIAAVNANNSLRMTVSLSDRLIKGWCGD